MSSADTGIKVLVTSIDGTKRIVGGPLGSTFYAQLEEKIGSSGNWICSQNRFMGTAEQRALWLKVEASVEPLYSITP